MLEIGGWGASSANSLLHKELPAFQMTAIEEAISKLYGWYSERKGSIDRNLLLSDK